MKKYLFSLACLLIAVSAFAQDEKQGLSYDYDFQVLPSDDQRYKDANKYFSERFNFLQERNASEAVNSFKKVVNLYPGYAEAYFHMSAAYNLLGELQSSIDCLNKAIEIKPDYDQAYMGLGAVYLSLGDNEKAKLNFDMAIGLYKSHGDLDSVSQLESIRSQIP